MSISAVWQEALIFFAQNPISHSLLFRFRSAEEKEHEVAFYSVIDHLKEEKDRLVLLCCEENCNEKEYVLCPRLGLRIIYGYNPNKSVYMVFEAGHIPDKINTKLMATDETVDFIIHNINNYPEIRRCLGKDGVELAERIRTVSIAKRRWLIGISDSIIVFEKKLGSQSRVIICGYETAVIIDVVRIRTDYNGTETLEGFAQRLYAIKPNINVYCVETRHEVFEKFSKLSFINVYTNPNEIENNDITAKITKSHSSVSAKISDHFTTCKKLDEYFPFMQFLQKIR